MTRGHWTTVQMVVRTEKLGNLQDFLNYLDGELIRDKTTKSGCYFICRVKIPAENKEALLDSQVRFL